MERLPSGIELLLEALPIPVVVSTIAGKVLYCNQAFAELSGFTDESFAGQQLLTYISDRRSRGMVSLDTYSRGDIDFSTRWGTLIPLCLQVARPGARVDDEDLCLLTFTPRTDGSGKNVPHSSKLESLGAIAGGVAHDLNNILTGVLGHVSFLRLALPEGESYQDSLSAIEEGARRAASMTQQILGFVKEQQVATRPINLSLVVAAGINLMKGALPKNIVINYTGDREDVYVEGDDTRLSQLFINLAINARDALPNGGNVGVDLVRVIFDDESCQDRAGLTPGEFARLSISDNGTGMPPQVKERIFEPFFTTKSNQGTGLGLATVVSIVEGHQGYIEVESQVGSGTLFCVYLPTTAPQSEQLARDLAGPAKNPSPEKTLGKERILVVDDEEVVRTVIQRSLEHFGYEVDVALDGADAVSRYRHDPSKYSLVILDMMMPKMAGDEVYHRLSQIDQNVRVLLVSGYSSEGRAQAVLEAGALSFIQKPFAVEDLAREVRKCLDRNVPAVGKSSVIVRDDDDQK